MRILWSSNSLWAKTGYGNQTRIFLPRIAAMGHDVGLVAWHGLEGGLLNTSVTHGDQTYPLPLYPRYRDGYGNDVIAGHAEQFKADIVLSLIDTWVLKHEQYGAWGRWCPWFPIDQEPMPPPVYEQAIHAFRPIVYSRFGQRMAHEAGLDVAYVPHGVESDIFCPGDQRPARADLDWEQDVFQVGMVAANKDYPSRKSLVENIRAFAMLARKHSDARLYLHTDPGGENSAGATNIPEWVEREGIVDKVSYVDPYQYLVGCPDVQMIDIYRACDVLLSVSRGEGFGIPILEAQSCGTPAIVGGWSAMPEICFGGWMVDKKDSTPEPTLLAANQCIPHVGAIYECLEQAYNQAKDRRAAARVGALAYDADLVAAEYWKPVLEDIERRLDGAKVLEARLIAQVAA